MLAVVGLTLGTLPAFAGEAGSSDWQLEPSARVELGMVASHSSDDEDALVIDSEAAYLRGQIGVELRNDVTAVSLEADRIQLERLGASSGRSHYDRDRFTATLTRKLNSQWEVELRARLYDDLISIESIDTDEVQGSVRVQYEPAQAHRFRLAGSWRERRYSDGAGPGGTESRGDGPRFDAEYRHRLGRYHYLAIDMRLEEISSDNPERGYSRESAGIAYTVPITSELRLRPAAEWRHTRFTGRLLAPGEPRHDTALVSEIELLWWPGDWRIEAEAKYQFGNSNDILRDREGYRLSLSVGHVF